MGNVVSHKQTVVTWESLKDQSLYTEERDTVMKEKDPEGVGGN